jgi:hypothetical protein
VILNVSELGLAIEVVRSLTGGPFLKMHFQSPGSEAWTETRARVVWIGTSEKTAGIEFVDLPNESRTRIEKWISSIVLARESEKLTLHAENVGLRRSPAGGESDRTVSIPEGEATGRNEDGSRAKIAADPATVLPRATETLAVETVSRDSGAECTKPTAKEHRRQQTTGVLVGPAYESRSYGRPIGGNERTISSRKSSKLIGAMILGTLLLTIVVLLAFHLRMTGSIHQATENPVEAKQPEPPSSGLTNPEKPSVDPSLSVGRSGFVLEVGAMRYKENADALAESLSQRKFPAFVSRRGTHHFYRVMVGPYRTPALMLGVKAELENQGLDTIPMQWNTSAQK